jgi:Ca2+-binding EF-hand superfamily protein
MTFFCLGLVFAIHAFAQPADKQELTQEFFNMDANKDGVISPEEIEAYSDRAFSEMDKDTNEYLDTNELVVDSEPGMVLKQADKDQNGLVTRQEAKAQFKEYFQAMDTNKDNQVSEVEYTDYWKVQRKF